MATGKGSARSTSGYSGCASAAASPAYCTAMGKLLLAGLPEPERSKRITKLKLARKGSRSITSKTALRQELQSIDAIGLALSDRELSPVLLSIAAPVRDEAGVVVAAVALEAHTAAATPEGLLRDTAPFLGAAAARLAESLAPPAGSNGASAAPRPRPLNGVLTRVAPRSRLPRARVAVG